MKYAYPLKIHFKFLALAPRINVTDAEGKEIFYIEQKLFAMRESVKVFNNSTDKKLLYTIKANQIIDFSAKYLFEKADSHEQLGSVQQEGIRSLFQASYMVADKNDKQLFKVTQANPFIAVLDALINMIPYIGILTGFFLNPKYEIVGEDKKPVMTMTKRPSFLESTFTITSEKDLSEAQELLNLLSCLMVVQLERNRG